MSNETSYGCPKDVHVLCGNSAYEISHKQSLIKFNNVGLIRLNRFLPNSLAKNKALTPFLVN